MTLVATTVFWGYNVVDAALTPDPRLEQALRDVDRSLGRGAR